MTAFITVLQSVFLSIVARVLTKAVLEKVLIHMIIGALDKLKDHTENTIDDNIVAELKTALGEGVKNADS
ncbi:MAG: hypothetical protein OEZ39_20325 [Gammaproteobacteria bacterium]|nr:hypothetical protein [Gammaproteobacteria bacterium]